MVTTALVVEAETVAASQWDPPIGVEDLALTSHMYMVNSRMTSTPLRINSGTSLRLLPNMEAKSRHSWPLSDAKKK